MPARTGKTTQPWFVGKVHGPKGAFQVPPAASQSFWFVGGSVGWVHGPLPGSVGH